MKAFCKITNEITKACIVGQGSDAEYYKSIGFSLMDVEQAYNGSWYVAGFAPVPPAPSMEEQKQKRSIAYAVEVDPITAHIQRLKDETMPDEAKIAVLMFERTEKVAKIKSKYPYPED